MTLIKNYTTELLGGLLTDCMLLKSAFSIIVLDENLNYKGEATLSQKC